MFFILDSALPAGGVVYVTAPSALTLGAGGCSMWVLGDDLTAPVSGSTSWVSASMSVSSSIGTCTVGSTGSVAAGVAMGMAVGATASAAGSFAPIGL